MRLNAGLSLGMRRRLDLATCVAVAFIFIQCPKHVLPDLRLFVVGCACRESRHRPLTMAKAAQAKSYLFDNSDYRKSCVTALPPASSAKKFMVKETLRCSDSQTHIYNLHCRNPDNVGDMSCAPALYWNALCEQIGSGPKADITLSDICGITGTQRELFGGTSESIIPDGAALIVGGGGLLAHRNFRGTMIRLATRTDVQGPVVFWGVGLNGYETHQRDASQPELPPYLARAGKRGNVLLGIRDYDPLSKFRWVPCASCLHQAFDYNVSIRASCQSERVGALTSTVPEGNQCADHLEGWIEQGLLGPDDLHSNRGTDLTPVVEFMRGYDVIVTSSYHAVYWATLLGKKVILCKAWSSKFRWMRHPPTLYSGDLLADIARARCYPDALKEARVASRDFAIDVFNLVGA